MSDFVESLAAHYATLGRHDLPWRQPEADGAFDPYKIIVSEIMLQQTQVPRVIPKYHEFLERFPTAYSLAAAPLGEVLVAWHGLGYNRRAKFLWQAAQMIISDFDGVLPRDQQRLEKLPGIGRNTAGAIMAYAFNEPAVFIETNIRTVYIHHFFTDRTDVTDAEILPFIERTLDVDNPRRFYWMLMDYGTYLKQTVGNVSRASRSYAKQTIFSGSLRQLRGKIVRLLAAGPLSRSALLQALQDERAIAVLISLEREGLIRQVRNLYSLP